MSEKENREPEEEREGEEFGELIKYTDGGFADGLATGALLDHIGFQGSAMGQWIVRTLSGEGESIFEGIFAIRKRISGASGSMAQAYGWGKLLGMGFGPSIGAAVSAADAVAGGIGAGVRHRT